MVAVVQTVDRCCGQLVSGDAVAARSPWSAMSIGEVIGVVGTMSGGSASGDTQAFNELVTAAGKLGDSMIESFAGGDARGEGADAGRSAGRELGELILTDSDVAAVTSNAMSSAADVVAATSKETPLLESMRRDAETKTASIIEVRASVERLMNYSYTDPMNEIDVHTDTVLGIVQNRWIANTATTAGTDLLSTTGDTTIATTSNTPYGNISTPLTTTTGGTPTTSTPTTSTPTNSGPTTTSRATTDPTGTPSNTRTTTTPTPVRAADNQTTADNRTTSRATPSTGQLPNSTVWQTNQDEKSRPNGTPGADSRDDPAAHNPDHDVTDPNLAGPVPYSGLNLPANPTGSPTGTPVGRPRVNGIPPTTLPPRSITGTSPVPTTASGPVNTGARPLASGPMAPAARAGGSGDDKKAHKSAGYLHTTDNGSEAVGAMPLVAPPVLGDWSHPGDDVADETRAGGETGSGPVRT